MWEWKCSSEGGELRSGTRGRKGACIQGCGVTKRIYGHVKLEKGKRSEYVEDTQCINERGVGKGGCVRLVEEGVVRE